MLTDAKAANTQFQAQKNTWLKAGEVAGSRLAAGDQLSRSRLPRPLIIFRTGVKPEYQTLATLANQGGGHSFTTSALGHLGANALGAVGGAIGGFPGAFVGEGLGYLYARPAIYKAMKGYDTRQKVKGIQAAYPQLTGQQPTGAQTGPQIPRTIGPLNVGDQIKNLMLGIGAS